MTPKQCREIWRGAVPKLAFNANNIEGEIFLSSEESLMELIPQVMVEATLDKSKLKIFLQKEFIDELFKQSSSGAIFEKISSSDAAILLEHVFTDPLQQLEDILQGKISLLNVTSTNEKPRANGLGFTIKTMGNQFAGILVNGDFSSLNRMAKLLSPFFAPKEKSYSNKCDVIIGPIELTKKDINEIQTGDLVSIGKKLEQNIAGYILRASGTYWNVSLEPTNAVIESDAKNFSDLAKTSDDILVGIRIGSVEIPASDVSKIKLDDKFPIERIKDNTAHLILDNHIIASGNLRNVADVLCLAVSELEAKNANG